MSIIYNRVAGQSVERVAALSDGIFGVAMTLLLLDLRAPAKELIHNESDLIRELILVVKKETPPEFDKAMRRRVIGAQVLYAIGALLCLINTYVSIGFIVLVQLNFVLAPKLPWLSEI